DALRIELPDRLDLLVVAASIAALPQALRDLEAFVRALRVEPVPAVDRFLRDDDLARPALVVELPEAGDEVESRADVFRMRRDALLELSERVEPGPHAPHLGDELLGAAEACEPVAQRAVGLEVDERGPRRDPVALGD